MKIYFKREDLASDTNLNEDGFQLRIRSRDVKRSRSSIVKRDIDKSDSRDRYRDFENDFHRYAVTEHVTGIVFDYILTRSKFPRMARC